MKAEYREADRPGYGKLWFSEAMFPEEPWEIAVQRATDRKFLTGNPDNPWVSETFFITLAGSGQPDGSLAIDVGPNIVNQLDRQETYRARLRGKDGEPLVAALRIPAITYSPDDSLDNTANVHEEKATTQPAQETKPEPAPQPASDSGPEAMPEPAPERLNLDESAVEKPSSPKFWRWAILAILIIGCLGWYFLDPRFKDGASEKTTSAPAAALGIGDQVRQFFKDENRTPAQAVALAAKIRPASPEEQDAVYRLYYYAAENGDAGAMLEYGECVDPSLPQWGTIQKDGPAAWLAYNKSPEQEKASKARSHLREWLEAQAASGNRQAADWLKEIAQ